MAKQQFSSAQREAIWLAYQRKCAYTREPLDVSDFHIDHIIPESLTGDVARLAQVLADLGLPSDFDVRGYGNLVPCKTRPNLQKGELIFDKAQVHFFLGIASSRVGDIQANLQKIERRNNRGRAVILLQQCLERGELSPDEVSSLLLTHSNSPEVIFQLVEAMQFADADEVRAVAKVDLESLRDRPIRLGDNDHIDGVTLTEDAGQKRHVRTCREYDDALAAGFFALSNYDIKMSTWFEHQCSLISVLQAALLPTESYVDEPRVGILDLELMPFALFPRIDPDGEDAPGGTYQDKVDDGTLVVRRLRQNLLQIEEPEGMGQQLVEVVRADFDGDGVEDILLFEYCYATGGTLGFGGIRILTRRAKGSVFEELVMPNKSLQPAGSAGV